jgi:methyl-accepting chemotaxis protein
MKELSIQRRITVILLSLGFLFCVLSGAFFLWRGQVKTLAQAKRDAMTHLERSVEMFMVSTRKFHDEFQAAKDKPEELKRILQDWTRTIEAVDKAVITDHGEGKPRVRLLGDGSIFARNPLAKTGVSIENDFERNAAAAIMKGEKLVESTEGGIYRMAAPLPSQAHRGCAECHFSWTDGEKANFDENVILGSLNVYIPMGEMTAMSRADSYIALGFIGAAFTCFIGAILLFMHRSVVKPVVEMVSTLSACSEQILTAAEEISESSQQLASGANQQASSLEETSSILTEASASVKQNAQNAGQAHIFSEHARAAVGKSGQAMERMSEAISKIEGSADETAKIVRTIDEIAFQTNLLALNAAVEAARAGEAGKGFAVVAEEVRNLAHRSADAARTTSVLIEESQRNAGQGVNASRDVDESMQEISSHSEKVNQVVSDVSMASNEQARGIEQINSAISSIDAVTQQMAANSEEMASASQELTGQAASMQFIVQRLSKLVHGGAEAYDENQSVRPIRKSASQYSKQTNQTTSLNNAEISGTRQVSQTPSAKIKIASPREVLDINEIDIKRF